MSNINIPELTKFHKIASSSTYAGGGTYSEPQRSGFFELAFEETDWKYRDSYTGHYQSWGEEVVWYEDKVIWTCLYGGGMEPEYHGNKEFADQTFEFLKKALMSKDQLSFCPRGPDIFKFDGYTYYCEWDGDISKFKGSEKILLNEKIVFTHTFFGGLVI